MARPVTPLGALGERVSATLDQGQDSRARAIEQARRLFFANNIHGVVPRQRPASRFAVPAALVACAAAVALFLAFRAPRPLQFTVDGGTGQAQTWFAAPASRPVVVQFSDGTVVKVQPLSRARVVETEQNGASLALENGTLTAEVVHKPQAAWRLIAGPFAVRVTGTRFDLQWDSAAQKFAITVREGSVGVAGSILGAERPVRAGETLLASVAEGTFDLINVSAARAAASVTAGAQAVAASAAAAAAELTPPPGVDVVNAPETSAKDSSSGVWRDFVKKGDLRQAFAAADAAGFQGVCDAATPAELLVLGDAARLSGRADRATEALFALRRRYPHDPRRAAAAFALGKVAFDQRHAYAQAAQWFATSAREQPSGPLSREARGREIEALRNAGDSAGAARVAADYLAKYPDGPHADIARSVLK